MVASPVEFIRRWNEAAQGARIAVTAVQMRDPTADSRVAEAKEKAKFARNEGRMNCLKRLWTVVMVGTVLALLGSLGIAIWAVVKFDRVVMQGFRYADRQLREMTDKTPASICAIRYDPWDIFDIPGLAMIVHTPANDSLFANLTKAVMSTDEGTFEIFEDEYVPAIARADGVPGCCPAEADRAVV
jgi:hypothetical protein